MILGAERSEKEVRQRVFDKRSGCTEILRGKEVGPRDWSHGVFSPGKDKGLFFQPLRRDLLRGRPAGNDDPLSKAKRNWGMSLGLAIQCSGQGWTGATPFPVNCAQWDGFTLV